MNMSQAHRRSFYHQRDENRMIDLQKRLMDVWQQRNVEDYYQEIILNFLDRISPNQVEYQIAKEIKATHQGQSFYFKLNNQLNSRQKAINNLEKLISQSKYQNKNQIISSICEEIKRLRDSNLGCAETIIQLNRQYGQKSDNLSSHQQQILQGLDQQNAFLKESFLKNYILFQNGYDPFFLYHYDLKGKRRPQSAHPDVDRLFNLNVSYACRLFKTKKQLLTIISTGKINERYSNNTPRREGSRRHHQLMRFSQKITNKHDTISTDRNIQNETQKTSIIFRGKPLSLQAAIQKDLLGNNKSMKECGAQSNFRKRKLHKIIPEILDLSYPKVDQRLSQIQTPEIKPQDYSQEADYEQKIIPRRNLSNAPPIFMSDQSKNLYRLISVQTMIPKKNRKKKSVVDYYKPQQEFQSPNWKVKLEPVISPKNIKPAKKKSSSPIVLQEKKKSLSPKKQNNLEKYIDQSEEQDLKEQANKQINKKIKKKRQDTSNLQLKQSLDRATASQNRKKQLKMRPGKYSFSELMKYLKGLRLKQQVKINTIFSAKWKQSLSKFQSYFCQFVEDSQLLAVAICIKTVEGPYSIKLWAPSYNCDLQTSNLLFQKYIEYIQKHTKEQQLYFDGGQIQELKSCNFVRKRQNLFLRKRVFKGTRKQSNFQLFLSLKCSNLIFSQASTASNILYSQQIQSFSKKNTYISPQVGLIKKRELSSEFLMLAKINEQIADLKTLNRLLKDQSFDTYQQDSKLKISNINALRFSINTAFKSSFIANKGYIRLSGVQLIKTQNEILYKVPCIKNNIFVYFGKGFSNCSKFIQSSSSKKQEAKTIELDVKMFNKELYGRLPVQPNEGCYGNWQISLWWQDELQGRVKHSLGTLQSLGPQPFFTGIEIEGQLVYAFQVKEDDFLL